MTPKPVKLSKAVQRELNRVPGSRVVVAAVFTITANQAGGYEDLGLRLESRRIKTGPPAPPPPSHGVYARRNLHGWKEKRTDLSKETRDLSSWAPSWNSGSYHLVSREIEA